MAVPGDCAQHGPWAKLHQKPAQGNKNSTDVGLPGVLQNPHGRCWETAHSFLPGSDVARLTGMANGLSSLRDQFAHLFAGRCDTQRFMLQRAASCFACYVLACLKLHMQPLAGLQPWAALVG